MKIPTSTSFVMAATASLALQSSALAVPLPDSPDLGGVSSHSAHAGPAAQFSGREHAVRTNSGSRKSLPGHGIKLRETDDADAASSDSLNALMQDVSGTMDGLGLRIREAEKDADASSTDSDMAALAARQAPVPPPGIPGATGSVTNVPAQMAGGVAQEGTHGIPSAVTGLVNNTLPQDAPKPQLSPGISLPQLPGAVPKMAEGAPKALAGTVEHNADTPAPVPNTIEQTAGSVVNGSPASSVTGLPGHAIGGTPLSGTAGSIAGLGQNEPNPIGTVGGIVSGLPVAGSTVGGLVQGVPNPLSTVQGAAGALPLSQVTGATSNVRLRRDVPNTAGTTGDIAGGVPVVGSTAGGVVQDVPNPLATVQGAPEALPLPAATGAASQTIGTIPVAVLIPGELTNAPAEMHNVPSAVSQQLGNTTATDAPNVLSNSTASGPAPPALSSLPAGMLELDKMPKGGTPLSALQRRTEPSGNDDDEGNEDGSASPSSTIATPSSSPVFTSSADDFPPSPSNSASAAPTPVMNIDVPAALSSAPISAPGVPIGSLPIPSSVPTPSLPVAAPIPSAAVPLQVFQAAGTPEHAAPSLPVSLPVSVPSGAPVNPPLASSPLSGLPISAPVPGASSLPVFIRARRTLGVRAEPQPSSPPTIDLPLPSGFAAPSAPLPNDTPPLLQPTAVGAKDAVSADVYTASPASFDGQVSVTSTAQPESGTLSMPPTVTSTSSMEAATTASSLSSRRRFFRFNREENV